jgi:predicted HTH domain antitoxin
MSHLILELPGDLTDALRVPADEQPARLRRELAVRLYQKELLSFGKARALAEMSKWDFFFLLGEEGIERHYDAEELAEDLRNLEALD